MASLAELWEEPQAKTRVPASVQQERDADAIKALQGEYQREYQRLQSGKTDAVENIRSLAQEISRRGGTLPAMPSVTVPAPSAQPVSSGSLADLWESAPTAEEQTVSKPRAGTRAAAPQPFVAQGQDLTVQQVPGKVADVFKRIMQGTASLADVAIASGAGLVGEAGYAASRALGAAPEKAAQIRQQIAGPYQNVIGGALGITKEPGYTGEASRQLMDFVGQNVEKGADWISQQTGLPKSDVENMMNTVMLAGGPKAARAAGAVGEALAPIAQIGATVEKPKIPFSAMKKAVEQQRQAAPSAAPGAAAPAGSVGAAGVTKASEVNNILANASPELQQRVSGIAPEAINTDALQTRALEEKHGINLSVGQRTGSKSAYASEWNNRGAHPDTLGPLFENQPKQMMDAIDNLKGSLAPDVYTASPSELGQTVISALKKNDAARVADIDSKYQALRDAAGGELPVDAPKLLSNVRERLKKDLQLTDAEGMSQFKELQRLAKDNDMTYDAFLAMRKNLATEARTNTNGTIRNIAGSMIEELEKLPLKTEVADLQPLAAAARQAAKERFKLIESNPAYKEAVNLELSPADIEAGIPAKGAELFIDKHTRQKGSLLRLLNEVGRESPAHQAIRVHELEKLKAGAGFKEGKGDFTPRGMSNYLHNTRDRLFDIYGPEGVTNLQELAVLGGKIAQPKTGVFNQSNTMASQIMEMAKQGIPSYLEGWAAAHTGGMSLPITQVGKKFWQSAKMKKFGQEAIDPYGGIVTKE